MANVIYSAILSGGSLRRRGSRCRSVQRASGTSRCIEWRTSRLDFASQSPYAVPFAFGAANPFLAYPGHCFAAWTR